MTKRDHIEFQERSVAKAFLITFRAYGTWLHGDERGSVDRRHYNRFGTSKIRPNTDTVERRTDQLKDVPFLLGAKERQIVEKAIKEVCQVREYVLFALHVRTNHAHVVAHGPAKPERMMDSFKAYSTRVLRDAGLISSDRRPWCRHGSTRYLWTDEHINKAVDYVINGQGDELPAFD
jgi:REP element-mobilizing transposase RayT